ncbi:hypothetical protein PBY51_006060 [Eleginops maclovinus]|uniref:Uncharacterized protein n=1 Tax=Eleginops maclovinus TaxID=56733 RepID=A0AAN7WR32_ELEMC|nr:hypothetical protein PBY51_006060 [Eleginops maclovinus]
MDTLPPLSGALGFLLRMGAYCKLASSYLRLPAKCIADLPPCQAPPPLPPTATISTPSASTNCVSVMLL